MSPRPSDVSATASELAAELRARGFSATEPHISYVPSEFFDGGYRWAIAFLSPELRVFGHTLEDVALKMTRKILALPAPKLSPDERAVCRRDFFEGIKEDAQQGADEKVSF